MALKVGSQVLLGPPCHALLKESQHHRGSWCICAASKKRKNGARQAPNRRTEPTDLQQESAVDHGGTARPTTAQPAAEKRGSRPGVSLSGKPIGWSILPHDDEAQSSSDSGPQEPEAGVRIDLLASSPAAEQDEALPAVTKGQVFRSCLQVSVVFVVAGASMRQAAQTVAITAMHNDAAQVDRLLQVPDHIPLPHLAVMLGSAAAVTAARQLLLQQWPAFAAATNKSNRQVLTPLSPFDLLWLAGLSGASEEFLFRGSLLPAILPDWRGVLLSGAAFGILHNSGGRNLAFAAWAGLVGTLYGFVFLYTQDIYVPMGAHSLANLGSAVLWLRANDWDKQ